MIQGSMKTVMKRKQKIYYQHYGCKGHTHPFIRIAGQYLKRFGFNIGDSIEVNVGNGHITIKKCIVGPPETKKFPLSEPSDTGSYGYVVIMASHNSVAK